MPITIQEIIASDTISQFVDKTNFNFDQLLLNGGGPSGPTGPKGPTGPAGGRGPKGSTWYDDAATSNPGNSPNVVPPTATPLSGDYYLQFNGQVWEYNGTTWVITTVDLQGPAGPKGSGGGFSESTGAPIFNESNILYNGPIGLNDGANATNEGVPSIMIGGVTSQTPQLTGIPFTAAYIVPQAIVVGNPSTLTSLLIHQRDSNSRGIVFHGGDTGIFDDYEQVDPALLSNISIGIDDKLILNVPKDPTSPLGQNQMRGIELSSEERSQLFRAGSDILFQSGVGPNTQLFAGQNSNFEINVGAGGSGGGGNVFKTVTLGSVGTTVLEAGNSSQITLVTNQSTQTGSWQVQANEIRGVASSDIKWYGASVVLDSISAGGGGAGAGPITLQSGSGGISLTTAGGGNINLNSDYNIQFISSAGVYNFNNLDNINPSLTGIVIHDAANNIGSINTASGFSTGVLSWDGTELQSSSGTDTSIVRWDGTTEVEDSDWFIDNSGNMYPTNTAKTLGTAAKRIGTIYLNSVIDYSSTINFISSAVNTVTMTTAGNTSIKTTENSSDLNVNDSISLSALNSSITHGDPMSSASTPNLYITGKSINSGGGFGGNIVMQGGGGLPGGNIYLFPGRGGAGSILQTGNVFVGVDETATVRNSQLGIRKTSPEYPLDVYGNGYDYAAKISNGETGSDSAGSLLLTNEDADCEIAFYPKLVTGVYNNGVQSNDAALIFRNSPTFTTTGFLIGSTGSGSNNNYFRIDGNSDINLNATNSGTSSINIESAYKISLDYVNAFPGAGVYIGANDTPLDAITSGSDNHIVLIDTLGADKGKLSRMTGTNLRTFIGAKAFVINHPDKEDSYLVHACIEGPEGAVYYRGESKLENGIMEVELPDYFESLTRLEDRTVQLTPKIEDIDDDISSLAAGRVVNGKFKVKGYNGNNKSQTFYWEVKAVRKDIDKLIVEPSKDDYELKGDGPYTYLVKR